MRMDRAWTMQKILLFWCLVLGAAALFLLCAGAESQTAEFYVEGEVIATERTDESGAMALPDVPECGSRQFLGWVLGDKLYAPKAAFWASGETGTLTFHALTVDLQTLSGAAASIDGEPWSLRFDASIPKEELERLVALVGRGNVTIGLLTAPCRKIQGKGTNFNHTDGADFVTDTCSFTPSFETGTLSVFSARVSGITASALLDKYAARGYLTVRYDTGDARTVYAPFSNAEHARAVHGVLAAAYEDFARAAGEKYTSAFRAGEEALFSPYSEAERALLVAALDRVVNVKTPTTANETTRVVSAYSLDEIHFLEFQFYTSPYEVKSATVGTNAMTITVTGKNGADFHNIATYYIGDSYSIYLLEKCRMGADGFVITQDIQTNIY